MREEMQTLGHLSAEDVAAYVDGMLEDGDRQRVEAHAAACDECRREIAEVAATVTQLRKRTHRRIWVPTAAAAAAIALLLVHPFWGGRGPVSTSRLRGPESTAPAEGTAAVRVLAPSDGSTVRPTGLVLLWHASGPGTAYQLTLTDDEGSVVWTVATTDTMAALPDTVTLAHASLYHWYVDGLLEDGRRASSGVHSFTTAR